MNKLSRTAVMAVAGGVIAGASFLAGKREGIEVGKMMANTKSEQIGYLKALNDMATKLVNKSDK